jgi:hypothetical protein
MLEEKKIVDKIEIINDAIQVRERNCILKNGVEIASSFNRFIVVKEDDRTNLDPKIKKIADALWNEEPTT